MDGTARPASFPEPFAFSRRTQSSGYPGTALCTAVVRPIVVEQFVVSDPKSAVHEPSSRLRRKVAIER